MEPTKTDKLLDDFEAGKLSRRDLIAGIGAAAVGGVLSGLIAGDRSVSATTDEALTRAEVLLSRLANLRVTIDKTSFNLVVNPNDPLVFGSQEHFDWIFDPYDGMLSGDITAARLKVDDDVPETLGKAGIHHGVGLRKTSDAEAEPIRATAANCSALELMNSPTADDHPWIWKVFDLKLAICEIEGMFHVGKELHTWLVNHPEESCRNCAAGLREQAGNYILPHYQHYLDPQATLATVLDKLDNTVNHASRIATVNRHDW